jgi:OOP family OmpA-OmpF porin
MKTRQLLSHCLVAAMLMATALPAVARQAPIMKEDQVTEDALVNALTPAPAATAQGVQPGQPALRTRSIRVMRDDDAAGANAAAKPAKPASASLLITFETNSAALTSRAKKLLDVVGAALASDKLASFRFAIEGYADPRGISSVNLKLSQARAESVRDYLVNTRNIDRARLEPIGKGDQDLMNKANPSAEENRRVTIVNLSK